MIESTDTRAPAKPGTPPSSRSRVAALLLEHDLVTQEQLREGEAVQAKQGGRLYEVLIQLGYLDPGRFNQLMSRQPGVASIDLSNYRVDTDAVKVVSKEVATDRLVLPIERIGKLLTVAMACPLETDTIEQIEQDTGLRVQPLFCSLGDIHTALGRYFNESGGADVAEEVDFSWIGLHDPPPESKPALEIAPPPAEESAPQSAEAPPSSAPAPAAAPPEQTRRREALAARIDDTAALPPAPETIQRVATAAEDPGFPVRDLAVICATDPAVTARLLSVTNSAAYGMPEQVDNIYLAAALLGASGTARVVGRCTGTTPPQEAAAFDYGAFLGQSRFCAAAADSLAKAAGVPRGPAQAAGLLHKLGRLVLALVDPEACAATRRDTLAEQLQAERAALGLTHPEAGLLLTRAWRLPASLCEAIRLHAEPLRAAEVNKLATVTALAAHMASVHTTGRGSLSLEAMAPLLEVLQLTGGQVTAIYASTRASFLK